MRLSTALRNLTWLWGGAFVIGLLVMFSRFAAGDFESSADAAGWLVPLIVPTAGTAASRWIGRVKEISEAVDVSSDLYNTAMVGSAIYLFLTLAAAIGLTADLMSDASLFLGALEGVLAIILAGLLLNTEPTQSKAEPTPPPAGDPEGE